MKYTKTNKRLLLFTPLVLIVLFVSSFATIFFSKNLNNNKNLEKLPAYSQNVKGIYYGQSPYDEAAYQTENQNDTYASSDPSYDFGRTAVVITDQDGYDHLYMWGDNTYGQLGQGETSYSDLTSSTQPLDGNFVTFTDLSGDPIEDYTIDQVAMSTTSTAAVVTYNSRDYLYMWGNTASGQLGLGEDVDSYTDLTVPSTGAPNPDAKLSTSPKIVRSYPEGNLKDIQLSNSLKGEHNFAIFEVSENAGQASETDTLYSFGSNDSGQLGLGSEDFSRGTPQIISSYGTNDGIENKIDAYALGSESAGVIIDENNSTSGSDEVYTWGSNAQGQLGLSDDKDKSSPTYVDINTGNDNTIINYSQIEMTNYSSLVVANESDGQQYVYTTGSNQSGELGNALNDGQNINSFTQIYQYSSGETIGEIDPGANSYLGYIEDNGTSSFYAWGDNRYGQLGIATDATPSGFTSTPTLLSIDYYSPWSETVYDFGMDGNNSYLITQKEDYSGKTYYVFYGWGDNSIAAANPFLEDGVIDQIGAVLIYGEEIISKITLRNAELVNTTSTTMMVDLSVYDPNDQFDPNAVTFYNGITELDYIYLGAQEGRDLSTDIYSYEIIGLTPNTNYNFLSVALSDGLYPSWLGLWTTTEAYDMIEISSIAFLSSTTTAATFAMDLNLNSSNIDDLISLHYSLTDNVSEEVEEGTIDASDLTYDADNDLYDFTINDLQEGHYYTLSNVYLELYNQDQTSTLFSPVVLTEDDAIVFSTATEGTTTISSVVFDESTIGETSLEFTVTIDSNESYDPDDLRVSYIETRSSDDSQLHQGDNPVLISSKSNSEANSYIYSLNNLDPRSLYTDFSFYLPTEYGEFGRPIYDYDNSLYNSEERLVTDVSPSTLDLTYGTNGMQIEEVNAKSITFSVKFEDLETRPELFQISYYEDGVQVTPDQGTTLSYLGYDEGTGTYQFKVENLQPHTYYEDMSLYEPEGASYVTRDWLFEYNYGSPFYTSGTGTTLTTNLMWLWISLSAFLIILLLLIVNLLLVTKYKREGNKFINEN